MHIGAGVTATAADNIKARESYFTDLSAARSSGRVSAEQYGPWSGFPGTGRISVGGGQRGARHGYGGEEEAPQEPEDEIILPPHVETTGRNTKIYEVMMMTGRSQAGIRAYANEHGITYDQAIDELFATKVPAEYKSPWEQHIEATGFAEGTSLEEAWASIGAGGEDQTVELYEASPEFPEGSMEHYQWDLREGLTTLNPDHWAVERQLYGHRLDDYMYSIADEFQSEAMGDGADLAASIPLADATVSQVTSNEGYTPHVDEEEEWSDPGGEDVSWGEEEKQTADWDEGADASGYSGSVQELFEATWGAGAKEQWEKERREWAVANQ